MRAMYVVGATALVVVVAGCSSELVKRPLAQDPTNFAAAEAPFHPPPSFESDPLLSSRSETREDQPTSKTYVCLMHPAVERDAPGQCPICGMTLVPKGGGK